MKKLFQVILAVAMMVSYLPLAEAGDSATLGVTVSFDQPLRIWSEPEGPFEVVESKHLEFTVIAEDPDAESVSLFAENLPEGASFWVLETLQDDFAPTNKATGTFSWTPDIGQSRETPYIVRLIATSSDGERAALEVSINVLADQPLRIWSDPEGPFEVKEGDELSCRVLAEDLDTTDVRITALSLPKSALYEPDARIQDANAIFTNDGGTLTWTPHVGQAQTDPYIAVFEAKNAEGDIVTLEVSISVLADQPLRIWSDPEGPFEVKEGSESTFSVIAEDLDTTYVRIEAVWLPKGAEFIMPEVIPAIGPDGELLPIIRRSGFFRWTPDIGQAQDMPYIAVFEAKNAEGDIVKLEVSITVLKDIPLIIWTEPEGPFKVIETNNLKFNVIVEDDPWSLTGVELKAVGLPENALFLVAYPLEPPLPSPEPPEPARIRGALYWTPDIGQASADPYIVTFQAVKEGVVLAEIKAEITIVEAEISIVLNQTSWALAGVKLGEERSNIDLTNNSPIHRVGNIGNIAVGVDISYVLAAGAIINPGLQPGKDTFATATRFQSVKHPVEPIPPDGRVYLGSLSPAIGEEYKSEDGLVLVYYAPTELSGPVDGMNTMYELRAFGIVPVQQGE